MIIGYGNLDRGDDAAGVLAAQRLRELGVSAIEHSGDGLALLDLWDGAEDVVVIDAMTSGAAVGTIRIFDATTPFAHETFPSTHQFGLREAIELARVMERFPRRLRVYAIEGACFDAGAFPSPEVLDSVEKVAQELSGAGFSLQSGR